MVPSVLRRAWTWWRRSVRREVTIGERGEQLAERYLVRQGMKIVGRRVHIGRGDIDLVAVDGRTVVFVEVKTRRSDAAGSPLEAVTLDKQRRLVRLALFYLRKHDLLNVAARFDVIAITCPDDGRSPEIQHIRSAFEPDAQFQFFC